MNRHESMLHIAAGSDVSVLLLGESGSGKEVAARYIHAHGKRAGGPFVALNCGAIAKGLTESILEGHGKGAFTGATDARLGVVRSAEKGTLFLDEIGEMPLEIQCKLLRILQERTVMPLGYSEAFPVDFRLVCATNRDLRAEVRAGRFREDLYFRLNVFPVRIPPLREREDFETLAEELWEGVAEGAGGLGPLTCHQLALLSNREWPGNVRQLKNVLQRYSLLKPYGVELDCVLEEEFREALPPPSDKGTVKPPMAGAAGRIGRWLGCSEVRERRYTVSPEWNLICSELARNDGNRSQTAMKLGISRGCLNYQIKKHTS